jgi:hypothetical protein
MKLGFLADSKMAPESCTSLYTRLTGKGRGRLWEGQKEERNPFNLFLVLLVCCG